MPTTKSEYWNNSYTQINVNNTQRRRLAQEFRDTYMQKDRELIRTLLGAVPGTTATKTRKRVAHSLVELGGKRTIETQTLVNRATTAGDVTDINGKIFAFNSQPTTYPRDRATRF